MIEGNPHLAATRSRRVPSAPPAVQGFLIATVSVVCLLGATSTKAEESLCSAEDTKRRIVVLFKKLVTNVPNAIIDWQNSEYKLTGIKTEDQTTCKADVQASFIFNDLGKRLAASREIGGLSETPQERTIHIRYSIEKTDDGQFYYTL